MRCYRKILHISYKDHVTNDEVCAKIQQATRLHKDLLTIIKRRKLVWSCFPFIRSGQNHLARHSERGKKTRAGRGRGGKTTSGNGQAWSSASPRGQWRTEKKGENGCKIICGAPTTLAVKGLMMMMMMMLSLCSARRRPRELLGGLGAVSTRSLVR